MVDAVVNAEPASEKVEITTEPGTDEGTGLTASNVANGLDKDDREWKVTIENRLESLQVTLTALSGVVTELQENPPMSTNLEKKSQLEEVETEKQLPPRMNGKKEKGRKQARSEWKMTRARYLGKGKKS